MSCSWKVQTQSCNCYLQQRRNRKHKPITCEIDDNERCPCSKHKKRKNRPSYGDCCKFRGQVKWNRDVKTGDLYQMRIISDPNTVKTAIEYRKLRERECGGVIEPNSPYFAHSDGTPWTAKDIQQNNILLLTPLLHLKIADPCYFYCIINLDFWPNEWRYILDKSERMLRKMEWNEKVTLYIQTRSNSNYYEIRNDHRASQKIKQLHRISRYGTLECQICLNCNKREKYETEYKLCGKCQIAKYCSRQCQKMDWKQHKIQCQTNSVKHQTIGERVKNVIFDTSLS
eukprot:555413_1